MSRDQQAIQDIWNAAQEILSFTAGMNYEALEVDRRTQAAVLYEIIIIGEAANRLSSEFCAQYPMIPWKDMIGMQNIALHILMRMGGRGSTPAVGAMPLHPIVLTRMRKAIFLPINKTK